MHVSSEGHGNIFKRTNNNHHLVGSRRIKHPRIALLLTSCSVCVLTPPCTMATPEKQFALPVDSEHKALKINLLSFALPHMRAFHLCWFGFFTSFVSTFAPAAMIPVVREDLGLSKADLGNAGMSLMCMRLLLRIFAALLALRAVPSFLCTAGRPHANATLYKYIHACSV